MITWRARNVSSQQGFLSWMLVTPARLVRTGCKYLGEAQEVPQRCQEEISQGRNLALDVQSPFSVSGVSLSGTSWGHFCLCRSGAGPDHGCFGPCTAMRHIVNVRAGTTSRLHIQCGAPFTEYKYSSASAQSGAQFPAWNSSTKHYAP